MANPRKGVEIESTSLCQSVMLDVLSSWRGSINKRIVFGMTLVFICFVFFSFGILVESQILIIVIGLLCR